MSSHSVSLRLEDAFRESPLLQQEISQHVARYPESHDLIQRISQYIIEFHQNATGHDEPTAKRRKVESSTSQIEMVNRSDLSSAVGMQKPLLRLPDISFSIPQRKKFALVLTETAIAAVGANGATEFGVFVKDIDFIACLPVPEKAAKQWNFCVFVKSSHGFTDPTTDPLLFTVNDIAPKNAQPTPDGLSVKDTILAALNRLLPSVGVIEPDPEIFKPLAAKSYRKDEIPSHVNAHIGTKEGFLFFLKGAVIWGFKKPLQCFLFESIDSSSYSSITQRTFSLTIKTSEQTGGREIEFSMIDQAEHPVIDEYLRKNDLKDASMSEARRAKIPPSLAKENAGKKSELQAAEEEIQGIDPDEDDEEDEDYEEDSDDDDGSFVSDSDDSEPNTSRQRATSANLAEEELGSELEDVEITDEEGDESD